MITKLLPITFAASIFSLAITSQPASGREFEDKFGRTITADLLSHAGAAGETVKIKKGGKEVQVKVAIFSEADQQFIRGWMKKTPPTIAYAFRITPKRIAVPATDADGPSSEKVELQITNLARTPVDGLKVEYRVYMNDYPSSIDDVQDLFEKAGGLAGLADRKNKIAPKLEHIEASVKIETALAYNKSATIETKPVLIHSGKNPLNGDRYKDEVVGIIARVIDPAGKTVYEYRDKKAKDFLWKVESPSEEFGISID